MLTRYLRSVVLKFLVGTPILPGQSRSTVLRACGITIGSDTAVRSRCVFTDSQVTIGRRCWVNFGVTFDATAPITLGDHVTIANNVMIITATHEIGPSEARASTERSSPVQIESGCWLGAGAMVMPGVTIGRGCIIAAGAVVSADCAPDGLYGGVPARRIRDL